MMKRFLAIFLIALFSVSFAGVNDVPKADNEIKVHDFANLFSPEEEESLGVMIHSYINDYNMDMVVVTTNENKQDDAQAYADDFYDYNGYGIGDTKDGILFLIDMDTRNIAISTTGEGIRIYDDERIESILDEAYNALPYEDYYDSAKAFVSTADRYASYGVPDSNINTYIDDNGRYVYEDNGTVYIDGKKPTESLLYNLNPLTGKHNYLLILGAGLVYAAFVVVRSYNSQKTVKQATSAAGYLSNTIWKQKDDRIINEHTTSVYIPPSDSSSGGYRSGGYSGGSSVHHSSSGSSHGGGSRHF